MKFLLGTKQKMTEVFDENGTVYPVTVIKTAPLTVTQVKTKEKDGYEAVQVGFGEKKEKRMRKAEKGHLKDLGNLRHLKEFRTAVGDLNRGSKIEPAVFVAGDKVTVSATSKGKGFQGVVKRHGFHGGPRSHGQKHSEREPGSIGTAGYQRVFKNRRMAGRMGGERVTVKNLEVIKVDPENNELLIKGAIPGVRGTLVEIVAK
ncbi:MAG TPA: 50S ribosomal protein L3 [Candidatus Paceibacterota bacterium]|nr:50S ribosomal protein L3 [Candidatus Paceibacterota bacterium]